MPNDLFREISQLRTEKINEATKNIDLLPTIDIDDELIMKAVDLLNQFNLRAFDAMHLASALKIKLDMNILKFACFDNKLLEASELVGLDGILN